MPTVKDILGFANRWYPLAVASAQPVALPSGTVIRLIAAPVELRDYLAQSFAGLLDAPDFQSTLAGHLPGDAFSQRRLKRLRETLQVLSGL